MRVILPPSETKRSGGGDSVLMIDQLSRPALTSARKKAVASLRKLSLNKSLATRVLKLSDRQLHYLAGNRNLTLAPTMPAIDRYTGVLYDALNAIELDDQARAWLYSSVSIQSALFGCIDAADEIPAYRLSASTALPGLTIGKAEASLKAFWQHAHATVWNNEQCFLLDLRSKDYVALAPIGDAIESAWVNVVSRGEDGKVRALNHFNKSAKGQLVRLLAQTRPNIESREDFLAWSAQNEIECDLADGGQLTLVADSVSVKAGQFA